MAKLGTAPEEPSQDLVASIEDQLGRRATSWRKPNTGLTPAQRFVVGFEDGTSYFVKAAVDDETETWLRNEHRVISTLDTMVPEVVAWIDAGDRPTLLLEDLSDAHWPADHWRRVGDAYEAVLWKPGQVELLVDALDRLSSVPAPLDLPSLAQSATPWWPTLELAFDRIEALGVCDGEWLRSLADDFAAAEATLDLSGSSLVHNDVRSDNVCFRGGEVILVDWSEPRVGWAGFDRANLLQGMPLEGGPDPFDVMPGCGAFAAWRAGEMLHRAIHDDVPEWLRGVFRRMAAIDLDWAAASLDLEPRVGPSWREL